MQLELAAADLNLLKSRPLVGTSTRTTYLHTADNFVQDLHDNFLSPGFTNALAVQASSVVNDTSAPTISAFSLDMNTAQLNITFSEAVNNATFNVPAITLQEAANSTSAANRVTLNATSTATFLSLTTFQVQLSASDRDRIKSVTGLAKSRANTFLSTPSALVNDFAGTAFARRSTSSGLQVATYTEDSTAPTLSSFTFDADASRLDLTFSEPILATSVSTARFTLRDVIGATTNTVQLTGGTTNTANSQIVSVNLSIADQDSLKLQTSVAISNVTTILQLQAGAVTDTAGVSIAAVTRPAASYTRDTTAPTVTSWTLDLNDDRITITFSEVVNLSSFVPGSYIIQNRNDSASNQTFNLTTRAAAGNAKSVSLGFDRTDSRAIKSNPDLASNNLNKYLRIGAGAVSDVAGNAIAATVSAIQVTTFTADSVSGQLLEFQFHLFNNTIELTFDDPMRISSFDATKLTLSSTNSSTAARFDFTSATTAATSADTSSAFITINIGAEDASTIGARAGLATSLANTFLSYPANLITNPNGQLITARAITNALQATGFTADTGGPNLRSFVLDVNQGVLRLTFSERINETRIAYTSITIQNSLTGATTSLTLTGRQNVSQSNSGVVNITLLAADLNSIKQRTNLGTLRSNTFITAGASYVFDRSGNAAAALSALQAASVIPDTSSPTLLRFEMDMNAGRITLTVSEIVNSSSVNMRDITLQHSATRSAARSVTLTGGTPPTTPATVLTLVLSSADLNAVKRLNLCAGTADCFISFPSSFLSDMAGRAIVAKPDGSAEQASNFTVDSVAPALANFVSLDMDAGTMQLSFNEPVNTASFRIAHLGLQNLPGTRAGFTLISYNLVNSTVTTSGNSESVNITLSTHDLNSIKAQGSLCTLPTNCYIRFPSGFVRDVAGVNNSAVNGSLAAHQPTLTPDTTSPTLEAWSLDMDLGTVQLTFSEVVDSDSLTITAITLQSMSNSNAAAAVSYRLTGGSATTTAPSTVMMFNFSLPDLTAIKANEPLLRFPNASYISFTASLVGDMRDPPTRNPVVVRNSSVALNAASFVPDTTAPRVVWFSLLDMNAGRLQIGFTEPMRTAGIVYSGITLRGTATSTTARYTLTGGTAIYKASATNRTEIEVIMSAEDLQQVKLVSGLATGQANSFLTLGRGAFKDLSNGNDIEPQTTGLPVTVFVRDSVPPSILNFTLDVDNGQLILTFDDVMNTSSVVASRITLQSTSSSSANSLTLTGGSTTSPNGYNITWELSDADLDALKLRTGLGTTSSNTFLTATTGAVLDAAGETSRGILTIAALQGLSVTTDTTKPTLARWSLNLASNTLDLTFSEAVSNTSLQLRNIRIRDDNSRTAPLQSLNLTGGTFNGSSDSRRFTVQLLKADYSALKSNSGLATSITTGPANTYLDFPAATVSDAAGNAINSTQPTAGTPILAAVLTPDTIAPLLQRYDLDLDGTSATLTLTFDEPVTGTSVNVTLLTLAEQRSSPTSTVQLSFGSTSRTNADVVTVTLSANDLDQVKLRPALATSNTTVFLQIAAGFVNDIDGRSFAGIAAAASFNPTVFTPDTSGPSLTAYRLDMQDGRLFLTFNEPIRASSFDASGLTLQGLSNSPLPTYTITSAVLSPASNARALAVNLSSTDTNAIKRITGLASSASNSFLTMASTTFTDMANNRVTAIPTSQALRPYNFTADALSPTLLAFDMDLTRGVLTLSFSETVNASSLNVSSIVLQPSSATTITANSVRLTGGTRSTADNSVLTVTLTASDLNRIKNNTGLFTQMSNAYLFLGERAVQDTSQRPLAEPLSSLNVTGLTLDTASPTLLSFDLRMNNNVLPLELVLRFSELVNVSSFRPNQITLYAANSTTALNVPLTGGTTVNPGTNAAEIVLRISTSDLASIRTNTPIGVARSSTFLSLTSQAVLDMNRQPLSPPSPSRVQVTTHTADLTPPSLTGYSLDLDGAGSLVLTYNESVLAANFTVASVTLTSGTATGAASFRLTNSTASAVAGATSQVRVSLSQYDLNQIKANNVLAFNDSTTFLSTAAGVVPDRAENLAAAVSNRAVTTFTSDATSPSVTRFDLSISSKLVTLQFNEAVDTSTFQPTFITIQNGRSATPSQSVKLTGGILNSTDGTEVRFYLTDADRNSIQAMLGLATNRSTAYLSLTVDFIADHAGNLVNRITGANALQAGTFSPDALRPSLTAFSLNLNSTKLVLTFDEAVLQTSLNLPQFQLQNARSAPTVRYNLQTVVTATTATAVVEVTLSTADLAAIKLRDLCNSSANCFASFPATLVTDAAGQQVFPRLDSNALAANFTADVAGPKIISFVEIDYIRGTLTLSFDEPVDVSTLNATAITLQDFYESPAQTYKLTGGTTASVDGSVVVLNLTSTDLSGIKAMDNLCHKRGSCYITASSSLIKDLKGIANQPQQSGAPGLVAGGFVTDQTRPTLLRYTFDLDSDRLILTFSEPMRASDLVIGSITLQAAVTANASNSYVLTTSTGPTVDGVAVVTVSLSAVDSQGVKSRSIGLSNTSTYLTIAANAIRDMSFPTAQVLAAINNGSARAVDTYVADAQPPTITSFTYDHNRDQILLTFSEPIQRSTLNVTLFTLHSAASRGANLTLSAGNVTDNTLISLTAVIQLGSADIERLKLSTSLARNRTTTYLSALQRAALDASNNPLSARTPLLAASFVSDTSRPQFTAWQLDLSTGDMNLTFSDVVRARTFSATAFTVQAARSSTNSITLTSSTTVVNVNDDGYVLRVTISASDLFNIKSQSGLARTVDNAYMTVAAHGVDDVYGVDVLAVTNGNGIRATRLIADTSQPQLVEFSLDMNTGTVHLSFSDTVNLTSFVQTRVVLVNSNATSPTALRLSGGTTSRSGVGRIISIRLSAAQFNQLAATTNLGTSNSTSYVSLDASAAFDLSGNAAPAARAVQVTNFTADALRPTLLSYGLDMDNGQLSMTFSETVRGLSLTATRLTLQHVGNSVNSALRYTLMDAGTVSSANATVVNLTMSNRDLNGIKSIAALAKSASSTFLSFAANMVEDMASAPNGIAAVAATQGVAVTAIGYSPDVQDPQLTNFTLDVNSSPAVLRLTFNEAVLGTSLMPAEFTLRESRSPTGQSYKLTGGTRSGTNGVVQSISLTTTDLQEIQKLNRTATSDSNTYIIVTSNGVQDMFGRNLTALSVAQALLTAGLTEDATAPTLQSFTLNMNTGILTLTFNEVIDLSQVDVTQFILQNDIAGTVSVNLTSQSSVSSASNSQTFDVNLGLDQDGIKLETRLATALNNTYLLLGAGAVRDMQGIASAALARARNVSGFTADTTAPVLTNFTYDASQNLIALTFSEPVNRQTLQVGKFTIRYNRTTNLPASGVQALTQGISSSSSSNGKVISINVGSSDSVALQSKAELATGPGNTFLTVDADAIRDMASNPIVTLPNSLALQAAVVTGDSSGPNMTSFTLDVDSQALVLTFSEAIDFTSFTATTITLSNSTAAGAESVRLTRPGTVTRPSSTVIQLILDQVDLDAIKAARTVGSSVTNTFLTHAVGVVQDFARNNAPARTVGLRASNVTVDGTAPTFTDFSLDLNNGLLSLTFNEAVDIASLNISQVQLQDRVPVPAQKHSLVNTVVPSSISKTANVTLAAADLDAVKRLSLCTVQTDCYISFPAGTITDVQGNNVVAVSEILAKQAARYVPDTTNPALAQFAAIDWDGSGLITLDFTETVDVSTFTITSITLQDWFGGMPVDSVRRLTGGTVTTTNNVRVSFVPTKADLDFIKADADLCLDATSCFVRFGVDLVQDTAGNNVTAVGNATVFPRTEQAVTFTPDTTSPELLTWSLDLNSAQVILTFSEPVIAGSVLTRVIVLLDAGSAATATFNLTGDALRSTGNTLTVSFTLRADDLRSIKANTALCTGTNSCYAAFPTTLADDVVNNRVVARNTSAALQLTTFTRDSVSPRLSQFASLDMNLGTLTLSFDEPIDSATLNAPRLVLQSTMGGGTTYRLTGAQNITTAADKTQLSFSFNAADLQGIKVAAALAANRGSSYIIANAAFIRDTSSNNASAATALQVCLRTYANSVPFILKSSFASASVHSTRVPLCVRRFGLVLAPQCVCCL